VGWREADWLMAGWREADWLGSFIETWSSQHASSQSASSQSIMPSFFCSQIRV